MKHNTVLIAFNLSTFSHIYFNPLSSKRILCTIKQATILDNLLPLSIIHKQSGIISILIKY